MPSIIPGYAYDVFISYRLKDNKYDGWVTAFVANLTKELEATFKESVNIYFDENPHDGLLETHDVHKSLEGKLKCLVFIPIISQTYCDPNSFAWHHELLAFHDWANKADRGLDVLLPNGNVSSRILPVRIHEIDSDDRILLENLLGHLRCVDFIFKSPGINRPLAPKDDEVRKSDQILYRDQVNKVANSLKAILFGLKNKQTQTTEKFSDFVSTSSLLKGQSPKPAQRKVLAISSAGLILLLGAGYLLFNKQINAILFSQQTNLERSIAVLPFKNFSQDGNDEYFSDGMTEEVINYLAKVGKLKVISHTSTGQYKHAGKDIRTIASELGVSYILEGSVRKDGNQIRISVQLIEPINGFHLWNEKYDREISNVLQVQSEISKEVAEALSIVLSATEKSNIEHTQKINLTAYDTYLNARSELMNYRIAGPTQGHQYLKNAISLFKNSIQSDSSFARAYSGLGMALMHRRDLGDFSVLDQNTLDSAKLLSDKSLSLDDRTDEAHYLKGSYFAGIGEYESAKKEFEQTLEINPNYVDALMLLAQINMGSYNSGMIDFVSGLKYMHRAVEIGKGPELAGNLSSLAWAYFEMGLSDKAMALISKAAKLRNDPAELYYTESSIERGKGNYKKALYFAEQAFQLDSTNWSYVDQKAWLLYFTGDYQGALNIRLGWRNVVNVDPQTNLSRIAYLQWKLGDKQTAIKNFNQQIQVAKQSIKDNDLFAQGKYAHYDLAAMYAFLGEKENAYYYLTEVARSAYMPSWWIRFIKEDPFLDSLRNEERFKTILSKMQEKNASERKRVVQWLNEQQLTGRLEKD